MNIQWQSIVIKTSDKYGEIVGDTPFSLLYSPRFTWLPEAYKIWRESDEQPYAFFFWFLFWQELKSCVISHIFCNTDTIERLKVNSERWIDFIWNDLHQAGIFEAATITTKTITTRIELVNHASEELLSVLSWDSQRTAKLKKVSGHDLGTLRQQYVRFCMQFYDELISEIKKIENNKQKIEKALIARRDKMHDKFLQGHQVEAILK